MRVGKQSEAVKRCFWNDLENGLIFYSQFSVVFVIFWIFVIFKIFGSLLQVPRYTQWVVELSFDHLVKGPPLLFHQIRIIMARQEPNCDLESSRAAPPSAIILADLI